MERWEHFEFKNTAGGASDDIFYFTKEICAKRDVYTSAGERRDGLFV